MIARNFYCNFLLLNNNNNDNNTNDDDDDDDNNIPQIYMYMVLNGALQYL